MRRRRAYPLSSSRPSAHSAPSGRDGVAGPHTWRALIRTVRRGSEGDAVRAVQEEFQFRNLSGDPSRGSQVDGIVGPMTWQALISGMLSF